MTRNDIYFFLLLGCEIRPHELLRNPEVRTEGRRGDNRCYTRLDRDGDEEGQVHDGGRRRNAMEGRKRSKIVIITSYIFSSCFLNSSTCSLETCYNNSRSILCFKANVRGGPVEEFAKHIVSGACRGDPYVKYPSWYDVFFLYRVFAPKVLHWTFRFLLTNGGATRTTSFIGTGRPLLEPFSPQRTGTPLLEASSPRRFLGSPDRASKGSNGRRLSFSE